MCFEGEPPTRSHEGELIGSGTDVWGSGSATLSCGTVAAYLPPKVGWRTRSSLVFQLAQRWVEASHRPLLEIRRGPLNGAPSGSGRRCIAGLADVPSEEAFVLVSTSRNCHRWKLTESFLTF